MVTKKKWSAKVTETSHALILPDGIFQQSAKTIAQELKKAAESRSSESKAHSDYQAAMSMLNFYINRAGKNLKAEDKKRLEEAKLELKKLFERG
jgi:soluble cytochrome b562